MFIGALFTIVKTWTQHKHSSGEDWLNKMSISIVGAKDRSPPNVLRRHFDYYNLKLLKTQPVQEHSEPPLSP